jgi:hypothetical protein
MTPDERDALLKEHRTWQLFRTVYRWDTQHHTRFEAVLTSSNRLSRSDPTFVPSSASAQLARNPYIAPEDLMQYMVDEDEEMSLFAVSSNLLRRRQELTDRLWLTTSNRARCSTPPLPLKQDMATCHRLYARSEPPKPVIKPFHHPLTPTLPFVILTVPA